MFHVGVQVDHEGVTEEKFVLAVEVEGHVVSELHRGERDSMAG